MLAVDDEEPALAELLFLLRTDPRVRTAEGVLGPAGALRRLARALDEAPDGAGAVDAVFLDIRMAGLSGLDLARLLAGAAAPPPVVFVTAHEEFARQAGELQAVDYLLKPVRRERLAETVGRVAELAGAGRAPARQARTGDAAGRTRSGAASLAEHIPVEGEGVTRPLPVADIIRAEARGEHTRLHTPEGTHLVRIPLATLEEHWRSRGFVRIHRRHLVSLARIDELRVDAGGLTVVIGATALAVSRRNARMLRDLLIRRATEDGTGDRH
ncbi:LytR/AlgR family response regulator transcription factor [Streptomyces sp. NPDC015171]|uniref:LytR/AlgR family response regulator transcription factor n=1 Tax=Streptomyces sp. NPDC015171 TaxID=3364945 RepID=UPI0036FF1388